MKEQLIEQYKLKSIEIGDIVNLSIPYTTTEMVKVKGVKGLQEQDKERTYNGYGEVINISSEYYVLYIINFSQGFPSFIKRDWETNYCEIPKEYCTINTDNIGYNPVFSKELKMNEHRQSLEALFFKTESREREINELNWNPIFNTKEGIVHYQRDLCWSLQDKQLLIESIYNQINIGKFVFRKRGYVYAVKYFNDPVINGCYYDIVDGKQRLNALVEFKDNKFPDLSGYYYKDFSHNAKRKFNNYFGLTIAELDEDTTDEDVKELFLKINFSGVQMSREHLDFVKTINLK
jgi:hypothetical protein